MIIKSNSNKYSITAMCRCLKISRKAYYYKIKKVQTTSIIDDLIINIFKNSRNNYGTRKIRHILERDHGLLISRRTISNIMYKYALISNYTIKKFKNYKSKVNNDVIENIVNRKFDNQKLHNVVVSDLTYVNVAGKWNYICILLDLFNREIIGYAVGFKKNSMLVENAFINANIPLKNINLFHTDRGSEFKNKIVDDILKAFSIKRSLSNKGCPHDNAVAEAGFKIIKTEFVRKRRFTDLDELKLEFFDYVNWYNNQRIHGSLGYLTPVAYRELPST